MISITVLIPVYNNYHTLAQRIQSIIDQTTEIDQLIIINDCSTDDSFTYLSDFEFPKNIKVLLVNNPKNSGSPFGSWKKAFGLTKGELIWIAEADDFCDPDFLNKLVKAFDDPEVVVSHCRSYDYRSEDNYKKNQWWNSFDKDIWEKDFVADGKDLIRKFGRFKSPVINVSSAVFRKNALEGLEIPSNFKYCGDWWFWAQIFQKGKVSFTAEPLNFYRIHENSATAYNNLNLLLRAEEATVISEKINKLSKTEFKYSENYYWLVDFWIAALLTNKGLKTIHSFHRHIPKSFWMPVFKKVFNHYQQKIIS
jgi:glycosyltransferase involved in cell wall biosynthesis